MAGSNRGAGAPIKPTVDGQGAARHRRFSWLSTRKMTSLSKLGDANLTTRIGHVSGLSIDQDEKIPNAARLGGRLPWAW